MIIPKDIGSIKFGLLDPKKIRKMSQVRVINPDTYDDDGYPIEGGLMDLRMGVIDPGLRCKTCSGRPATCPGHFGHIELVRPVVHIGYVKIIYTLLRSTCRKCGRILLPEDDVEKLKRIMFAEEGAEEIEEEEEKEQVALNLIDKSKGVNKCPHCGEPQNKIRLVRPTTFYEGDQRLFPSQIRERIERIPDDELKIFGINTEEARPEWALLTVLPVPPVTTRPSITLETGERSEDDLTHKLVDIIRINQRLADNISAGAPQLIIEDLWDLLQYHVTTYFNNNVSGIPPAKHRSGRALTTLYQRLKGKEGRFRYYLSGKRVNFSARTVITPDPNIDIEELGVPKQIAEELTIPVSVTEWNLDQIKKIILNKEYPTAKYVISPEKRKKIITEFNREEVAEEIKPGYIVERQLIDNDPVVFNRQPSLHRMSMMGHRVKVLPGKTFRINDAVSRPYNADYDGDEMNLHVPQTEESREEVEQLMLIPNNIISIRHGNTIIGANLDHVTGTYLLTKKGTKFSRKKAIRLLGKIGITDLPKKDTLTGKEIFSMIIPDNISIEYAGKTCKKCATCEKEKCPFDAYIKIKNGKLIAGAVEGAGIKSPGHIIREIFKKNGPEAAAEFINRMTRLALEVISEMGFTTSLEEGDMPEEIKKEIARNNDKAEKAVDKLIEKYKNNELPDVPGKTPEEVLEDTIMVELGKARTLAISLTKRALGQDNSDVIMATIGAKGTPHHLVQMQAMIGQSSLRGKRLTQRGYRYKMLPHFKPGDISAKPGGFIKSSFKSGLDPIEAFLQAMSGRDSIVDKGINTAVSGYFYRRVLHALIDLWVRADGSVRSAAGEIIQFRYGEDGINPMKKDNLDIDKIVQEVKEGS